MLVLVLVAPVLAGDVDQYIKDLKDENSIARANAAWALGKIKDPKAVDPIDTDPQG
jgi:HEAT repeat protein